MNYYLCNVLVVSAKAADTVIDYLSNQHWNDIKSTNCFSEDETPLIYRGSTGDNATIICMYPVKGLHSFDVYEKSHSGTMRDRAKRDIGEYITERLFRGCVQR